MVARMDYDAEASCLVSKPTQLQLKLQSTNQVIAEVDFDLAAFGNKEINKYKMRMMDTVASQGFSSADSVYSASATSLESLLLMTEDSFELEKKNQNQRNS